MYFFDSELDRRRFLVQAGSMLSAVSGGTLMAKHGGAAGEPMAQTSNQRGDAQFVQGIDPTNAVDEYNRRKLEAVSDADLYRGVVEIVSKPQAKGINSFALHAPLELMARYGLLSYVQPFDRELARLQMVATGSVYESGVEVVERPDPITPFPSVSAAKQEFTKTFRNADPDGLDAVMLQIARQFGTSSLVHQLTPLALPTLTGAAHSHIGLWLLLRHGMAGETRDAFLLRAAVRRIAAQPNLQLSSFSGMAIAGTKPLAKSAAEIEEEILEKLTAPPLGKAGTSSLRPLMEAGEGTGNPDKLFGEFIAHDLTWEQMDAAFRAILRVCAHSMLQDDVKQAKFGWSHCLTLPQAACGLSSFNMDRKLALAVALVWITSYRSILSRREIDFGWAPKPLDGSPSLAEALRTSPEVAASRVWHADDEEIPLIRNVLATEASIRNDQHLVKYTRACFDIGSFDPSNTKLYLAAAAHLCGIWIQEMPEDEIRNRLQEGRDVG